MINGANVTIQPSVLCNNGTVERYFTGPAPAGWSAGALAGGSPASSVSLLLGLTTAGRIGFYIDYSELSAAGTHTFYVCRTHGTAGAVSVSYATSGDTHSQASGTLSWADGEADIKSFTVDVSAGNLSTHAGLGLGEHRIMATLSSPTGGTVLHRSTHTKAYGIVDNATMIASDDNAVFVNFGALSNGDGTRDAAYNNWPDAKANLGNKRYLYLQGTLDVDNTLENTGGFNGAATIYGLIPPSRASESTRLYIQEWPGQTCTIQGAAGRTDTVGFLANSSNVASFVTYKNLTLQNFDTTGGAGFQMCAGVYHGGAFEAVTVEGCTITNLNGEENQGGVRFDAGDAGWVWNTTITDVKTNGSSSNANAAAILIENADYTSFQRLSYDTMGRGIYHKKYGSGDVPADIRFCLGGSNLSNYHVVYADTTAFPSNNVVWGNIFKGDQSFGGCEAIDMDAAYGTDGTKSWIIGNVFYQIGFGTNAGTALAIGDNFCMFNNIWYDCRTGWIHKSATGSEVEFADFNTVYDAGHLYTRYQYKGTNYASDTALNAANNSLAANDSSADPQFTNAASNDFTRQGSPNDGLSGTQQGVYLTGAETIGAA